MISCARRAFRKPLAPVRAHWQRAFVSQKTLVAKGAPASKRRLRDLLAEHSLLVLATVGAALAAISSELDLHSLGKSPADAVTKAAGAPPVQAAESVSYMHLNLYMCV
jgi:hypothetical protein